MVSVTEQAMLVYPQTRKRTELLVQLECVFLFVEAPTASPGEQKMFWVTIPFGSVARLKLAAENKQFIAEGKRVEISRLSIWPG